jgi:hypothetical protein
MTGNALTMNPIAGTNAYVNGAYGTPQSGLWGNVGSFGTTPSVFGIPAFQPQVPINQWNPFTPQAFQQPGFVGQTMSPMQTGFQNFQTPQFGYQGIGSTVQTTSQLLNTILQTTPPQVLNTVLQTTPPQVLPYILNALACQQACQQVLAQNPQAIMGINPQTISQPFFGYGTTNQTPVGFGSTIGGFGVNPFMTGGQTFGQTGACVGCQPGTQQWTPTVGFQTAFGQVVPQQPWINAIYGTW